MKDKYLKISKEISFALRHKPELFGLTLDSFGFVEILSLVSGINKRRILDFEVDPIMIKKYVKDTRSKRHEIVGSRIRALYGHSVNVNIEDSPTKPPDILYHGTLKKNSSSISSQGILSMTRQFVHLSETTKRALDVARRKEGEVLIYKINAKKAYDDGVHFFKRNGTWLTPNIDSKYIRD